jgi:hypothetical protein
MAARPPTDDTTDEPDIIEFGIAALDARLDQLDTSFPTTADVLVREYGDVSVPVDAAGNEITLREAMEQTAVQEFETERELLDVLHPVFEQRRQNSSRGYLSQLRALLPF